VTFTLILKEVLWCLLTEGRVSHYRIRNDFALDEAGLAEVRRELVEVKGWAVEEPGGAALLWAGAPSLPARPPAGPPMVAEAPPAPPAGAERRQLTVMFCDLVGSTDLSTRLDPEDLGDVIRAWQEAVAAIVRRLDGFLAKYMGDGILVYFGYPHAQEKDAERAVRTALAILEALPALNAGLARTKAVEIAVRIGIATGLVVVGESIGEGAASEKAVVGETPNLAARLQALAPPNGIVVGSVTRDLAGATFVWRDLGVHQLKGITGLVPAWAVSGLADAEPVEAAAGEGRAALLVGRDEEIGLLRRAWAQATEERRGQVVMVSGEAGIGKSTLTKVLRADVQARGLARMTFRCSPYHVNSALYPVIEHLKRAAGWQAEDDAAMRLSRLEAMVAGYTLNQAEAVPLLAGLLGVAAPPERYPPKSLTPQQVKQQTEDVLLAMTMEEAERRPVLEIWEDLHWADPSTLDLLGLLIDQAPTARLLIVATFRPEFVPPWPPRSHLTPITLNRLERPQIEAMANGLVGGRRLPQEVVEHIVRKTDGVPLYVEELTKTVLASGILRAEDGHYELTGPLSGLAIPASLQEVLMAQLDRVPTVREVAQLGAVLGREFGYEMLLSIAALEEPKLRDGLGQLVGAELLYQRGRPPRATYTFKHALIQDAAYHSLLKKRRQQYHRRAAALLEARFADTVEAQPELVAHHYAEAGQAEEAIAYLLKAGQRAARRSANQEVIAHVGRALGLLAEIPEGIGRATRELQLQRLLGTAYMATRGYAAPETGATYGRARRLAAMLADSEDIYPVLVGVWLFEMTRANYAAARQIAEEIFEHASAGSDEESLMVGHVTVGVIDSYTGFPAAATGHFDASVSLYRPDLSGPLAYRYGVGLGAAAYAHSAFCLWLAGRSGAAVARGEEAIRVLEETRHAFTFARGLYWNASMHALAGNWQTVLQRTERSIAAAEEGGFTMILPASRILRGAARAALGEGEAGIAEMRAGLDQYATTGARFQRTHLLTLLADALRRQGEAGAAMAVLREAADLIENTGERYIEAEVHRLQGAVARTRGAAGRRKAAALCGKALEVARRQGARPFELRAARDLAALLAESGERRQAADLLATVCAAFMEDLDVPDLDEAKALVEALA
jgi:class 3 adenylate cyclase/predicted ATPase